ncbi:GNAT family N-acetyltransferase [Luteipulveratus sp. YIM 133132]|uniref:GNAT family N-acetyltransferase n=1 Tax=Luteipulveratus flavus TaxID=3031728 RepID=UPI0023AFDE39|nr:GNAT family N-acetyltransferase [Luteipulveratus sp. YIM 133132]MDE9366082.1 GNAT family N-acetyltransferase [Luteipulveratus sp. YIM 133132]
MELTDGLTSRPLRLDDAGAVTSVMAAQEMHDVGQVVIEEADIVGDWQRPSFDVSASTVGVFDGDELVAYAEYSGGDRGDAAVAPAYRGRGLGTQLARWMQERARTAGADVVGMPVPQGSAGDRLLEALGYRERWTSWILTLPEGVDIEPQPVAAGYVVREADPAEYEQVWQVVEDAFLEWSERERETFEDFSARVTQRPGFAAWCLRVVVDPDDVVIGCACVHLDRETGYVDRLAVRRDQRGRGFARALLVDAFGVARSHGATVSELSTDSRTGALGLYERVGMTVTGTWVNRAADLSDD